jgi:tight adherence protein B
VVDTAAAAVGAGHSVAAALGMAAGTARPPIGDELRAAVDQAGRGAALAEAVDRWAAGSTVEGAPLVAAAVGLASEAGSDAGPALASVAATLRERRAVDREVHALSAQARLSAAVIGVAPLVFAVVASGADRSTARFLLGSPGGWSCAAAGAALDLGGWWWMRRITGSVR